MPADLRDMFKAACYRRGKDMRSVTLKLMELFIRKTQKFNTDGKIKGRGRKKKRKVAGVGD